MSNAPQSAGTEPSTTLTVSEDSILVAAVLRRDRKATAELLSVHADPVYAYVRNRLIPRTDLVEDVFQDVFLAAWQGLAGFRGTSSLRSWLLGIARHKVEDYYRLKLREALPIETEEGEPLPLTVEPEFDEAIDQQRLTEKVRHMLEHAARSLQPRSTLAVLGKPQCQRNGSRDGPDREGCGTHPGSGSGAV